MMTLREYFEREAEDCLARMAAAHAAGDDATARGALQRAARELRGAAQLAREAAVQRLARAVETALRPGSAVPESARLDPLLADTIAELRTLVRDGVEQAEAAARAEALAARWVEVAPTREPEAAGTAAGSDGRSGAGREFADFAAREVEAIAAALESAVVALTRAPNERAPIEAVLRRQRALLGAARLDEIPVVAETLRALDDLARVIVRLGVGVKGEWLDVFRSGRDVLAAAAGALHAGAQTGSSHALSRLRTLREELLERYGHIAAPAGAAESTAADGARDEAIIDVAALCYDREAALRRAMELRSRVERAIGDDAEAREAVDEVFDLLRIALG